MICFCFQSESGAPSLSQNAELKEPMGTGILIWGLVEASYSPVTVQRIAAIGVP